MNLWLDQDEISIEYPFMKGFYHMLNALYYIPLIVLASAALWKGLATIVGL